MRHFLGLLVGLAMTAVLLLGGGWAVVNTLGRTPPGATGLPLPSDTQTWIALAVMVVIGLLLGLLIAGRVSPLAGFVPSMVLLAWTVIYVLDAGRALSIAAEVPTVHASLDTAPVGMSVLLANGIYAMLGVALFVPVLMPSRWAGRARDEEGEYEEESGDPAYY
ncbi:hypothetical protein GCM10010156_54950 [Planobispora rosea]|uniref:Uncharacterized protein n=1 Tax=Planobispora rosea TaxID=35762 RepID=A0A8J3S2Y2_PLARO|nr:hypothetical protein [Planobispora rosea]GGS89535.1 hypothetical protein GCM10010156_54950 [Planobispora rosea]GIH86767.1 hypothetical protein Pro02_51750 [Planobispora rosea]